MPSHSVYAMVEIELRSSSVLYKHFTCCTTFPSPYERHLNSHISRVKEKVSPLSLSPLHKNNIEQKIGLCTRYIINNQ